MPWPSSDWTARQPHLAGGSDDEAANTIRCGQERVLCGYQTRMSNDRHSRPTAQNDSLPASTVMGGKHVGPYFDALFPPQEVSPWIARKLSSTGVGIARRLWDQREQRRGEYEDMHGTDRAVAGPASARGVPGLPVVRCARSFYEPLRLVRTSLCMAAPTPSVQWCIPRWSTSLAGRKVRPAMMTKCQVQHRVSIWRSPPP